MNKFQALIRSFKKSKEMRKAIKAEISLVDHEALHNTRKRLYDFLCADSILSTLITSFDFDQFSKTIDIIKAFGLEYSRRGDYIPITAFCFLIPLSATVGFFINNELNKDEFWFIVSSYFDN